MLSAIVGVRTGGHNLRSGAFMRSQIVFGATDSGGLAETLSGSGPLALAGQFKDGAMGSRSWKTPHSVRVRMRLARWCFDALPSEEPGVDR